jgi:predicted dehydrogenase
MLKKYKKQIVLGIVGLGVGAFHLKNSLEYKNCKVKYICDLDKKKLLFYKKKFKIKYATTNFDNIIKDKEVNTMVIASNDKDHSYQVINSLKNDKHVFIEKPLCLSMSELNLIKKVKKQRNNLIISSNLVLRTHPFFEMIFKNKKKIKKIYYIEGDYNYGRLDKLTKGWRGKIKNYSVILGGGIHLLDLIIKLKGLKIKSIFTSSNKIISKKFKNTPDDFAISILKFKDNSIAKICSNFSSSTDHHHIFNIYSESTSFFYHRDRSIQYFREKDKKSKIEVKYKYNNKTKAGMLKNFFDAINKGKKKLRISENELFYLMKICLRLVESQNKNKIIKL